MPPITMTKLKLSPNLIEPGLPSDPALRTVAQDVLARLKYSLAIVAAGEGIDSPGRLDDLFGRFLATRRETARGGYRTAARALLDSPQAARARELGRYATVDPKDYQAVGSDGVESKVARLAVDSELLRQDVGRFVERLERTVPRPPKINVDLAKLPKAPKIDLKIDVDLLAGLAFEKMRLFVREVRIVEETDEVGSDEINMGGAVTDPFGNSAVVNQFEVFSDADEGEAPATFGWSKVFATWDVATKPDGFPYVYSVLIALAEKDDGGFYQFLKELWEMLDEFVTEAIGGLAGAAVGAAIGSVIPGIGTVVGALVGFLLGALVGWIINWADNPDDIIGVKPVLMTLGACTRSYYDWAQLTSPGGWKTTLHFKGDGGRYDIDLAYKVFTQ